MNVSPRQSCLLCCLVYKLKLKQREGERTKGIILSKFDIKTMKPFTLMMILIYICGFNSTELILTRCYFYTS